MTATLEMNFENNLQGLRTPLKTPTSSRRNNALVQEQDGQPSCIFYKAWHSKPSTLHIVDPKQQSSQ